MTNGIILPIKPLRTDFDDLFWKTFYFCNFFLFPVVRWKRKLIVSNIDVAVGSNISFITLGNAWAMSIVVRSLSIIRNVSSDVRINRMYRSVQYPQCRNQWFSTDQRLQLSLLPRFVRLWARWSLLIAASLLDCRSQKEYDESHIISARHIRRVSPLQPFLNTVNSFSLQNGDGEFQMPWRAELETREHIVLYDSRTNDLPLKQEGKRSIAREREREMIVWSRWDLRVCWSPPASCRWFDHHQDRSRRLSTLLETVSFPSHPTISLFSQSRDLSSFSPPLIRVRSLPSGIRIASHLSEWNLSSVGLSGSTRTRDQFSNCQRFENPRLRQLHQTRRLSVRDPRCFCCCCCSSRVLLESRAVIRANTLVFPSTTFTRRRISSISCAMLFISSVRTSPVRLDGSVCCALSS